MQIFTIWAYRRGDKIIIPRLYDPLGFRLLYYPPQPRENYQTIPGQAPVIYGGLGLTWTR